jgi:hypothetical protein
MVPLLVCPQAFAALVQAVPYRAPAAQVVQLDEMHASPEVH